MDPVTHVAAGVLISQVRPGPCRGWSAVAGAAFALLPDVDYFIIFFDRLAFIRHHRGFTHSLVALPLFALLGAALARTLGDQRWFRPTFFLGLVVITSHLLLDLATSYGTQILAPFSRQQFTLDWLFIIDPYLTGLLLAGCVAAFLVPATWRRRAGAWSLAAAGVYFLLCGFYHHQALTLAHQVFSETSQPGQPSGGLRRRHTLTLPWEVFPTDPQGTTVAALPQPFSCRRWQLVAAASEEVQQAFVLLPYLAFEIQPGPRPAPRLPAGGCRVPNGSYRPPGELQVQVWSGLPEPDLSGPPEARAILDQYLEFARFPLLRRQEHRSDRELLEWLDLRFSVPGRGFPFVLQMQLDATGRVQLWRLGRCQEEE